MHEHDDKPRLRRVYILPNLFTALNLFLGIIALYAIYQGDMLKGCWLIVLAAVLDGVDGAVARLTHTQSRFGLEFDSLSDLVSFGVAPSLAAFVFLQPSDHGYTRILTAVCALFAVCGALRLARYNVQAAGSERKGFLGMPIPGAAMGIVSTVLLFERYNLESMRLTWLPFIGNSLTFQDLLQAFFPFLILGLALLMVSEVPYPSIIKKIHIQRHMSFSSLVALMLVIIPILALGSSDRIAVLFILAYGYLFFGLVHYGWLFFSRKEPSHGPDHPHAL